MTVRILHGDALEQLRTLADESVHSVVTDPPYAFAGGFMGKGWDNHDGRDDVAFGYWLAGFADGEGCFRVQRHERGTHTCTFTIKVRRDDKAALERIKRFVGHGTINDVEAEGNSSPTVRYAVQDQAGCAALVEVFRRFPLVAKKANEFEDWANAVNEWLGRPRGNRWHGSADQSKAAGFKGRLERLKHYVDVPWSGHRFQDWTRQWATEAMRVLKPGAHMLAFGSTRQYHRLVAGVEDAGFEIRDTVAWLHGQGFPKSLNLPNGWGTALKPAMELIVVARKPLIGTVAANVLKHGTGAINVDACRIDGGKRTPGYVTPAKAVFEPTSYGMRGHTEVDTTQGRWPANLIHDGSDEVLAGFPEGATGSITPYTSQSNGYDGGWGKQRNGVHVGDSGSAARFFYTAKASGEDRNIGSQALDERNHHPTVKPTDLMQYLVRLVTPPGGTVLDPFAGSGSTGLAADREGFDAILIEREAEYVEIARRRIVGDCPLFAELAA